MARKFSKLRRPIDADPERARRVKELTEALQVPPHPFEPGLGGICFMCGIAGRLILDDYYSMAVIGFKEDPIHQQQVETDA